jgi:hypothetical protein
MEIIGYVPAALTTISSAVYINRFCAFIVNRDYFLEQH